MKQRVINNLSTTVPDSGDNEVKHVEIVKGVSVQYYE